MRNIKLITAAVLVLISICSFIEMFKIGNTDFQVWSMYVLACVSSIVSLVILKSIK